MFRFTIRDVLWLTVVVALAIGWWADNHRIDEATARLEEDIKLLKKEIKLQREAGDDERAVLVEYRKRLAKDYSEFTGGRKLPDPQPGYVEALERLKTKPKTASPDEN